MRVSTERQPESQVVLQIEVDDDRLEKAKESAYRRLASRARIDGFRPGKAPRAVIESHLGPHTILHEAIDRLLPEVYREALEQEEIDPVDKADYELVTEEPLVAKFTVPVRPSIDLGDYTSLRVEREPVVVDPERVQETLEGLRHRYATLEPAERPAQWGNVVTADVRGEANGKTFVEETDATFALQEGRPLSLPGVAEGFIGHSKGDEFEIEVDIPEETAKQLEGGRARYQVKIKEIKEEVLPELDDEFARQAGEGFESLQALRERLEGDLRTALEEEAEHQYHDAVLDALAERAAKLEYPVVFVDREIDRQMEDMGWQVAGPQARKENGRREALERFLQQAGKSEEELRAELRPAAEQRVRRALVLSEVAEAEHILVEDPDVEAEIERLSSGSGSQSDDVRKLFSSENGRASLNRSLMNRKTLERLVQIASGGEAVEDEAPDSTSTDG